MKVKNSLYERKMRSISEYLQQLYKSSIYFLTSVESGCLRWFVSHDKYKNIFCTNYHFLFFQYFSLFLKGHFSGRSCKGYTNISKVGPCFYNALIKNIKAMWYFYMFSYLILMIDSGWKYFVCFSWNQSRYKIQYMINLLRSNNCVLFPCF